MDAEEKFELITRNLQELVGEEELKELLRDNQRGAWFLFRHARLDEQGRPIKHPYTQENRSGDGRGSPKYASHRWPGGGSPGIRSRFSGEVSRIPVLH